MKALIVVDAQYDFMPVSAEDYANEMGGALAVADGDEIIPVINDLLPKYDLVIFTKDWHHPAMYAFASQYPGKQPFDKYTNEQGEEDILWPDHCVENTRGANLHDDIQFEKCGKDFYIFKKGQMVHYHPYSGFSGTDLADFLREKNVTLVDIVGLATDYCVKDTALDAVKEGFETTIIWEGCKGIEKDLTNTIRDILDSGIRIR